MKRSLLISVLAATAVTLLCTSCGGSKVGRAPVRDLVLIYDGGEHRTVKWNAEQFADYVATDGETPEWLFDGFLFLEIHSGTGLSYASGYTPTPARKQDWITLIDKYLTPGRDIAALNECVGTMRERIPGPFHRRKIVLSLPVDRQAVRAIGVMQMHRVNGRNLAAGSVRLLDASVCMGRRITFMAFNVLEGFDELPRKSERLKAISLLGFHLCKYMVTRRTLTQAETEDGIKQLQKYAKDNDIPIDGIVVTYNDVAFSRSCGRTGHHYKDGLAFKFEDELYKTKLRSIEWTPGRTGEIAPVAIFDPVEIDGCEVSRASLHNLSFIEDMELMPGNHILVSKRNMIIPHVEENIDRGNFVMDQVIPHQCPCCGEPTRIHETKSKSENGEERIIKTLFCDNEGCETRRLKQFVHFVSKKAMNIEGLSEATLEKLIGRGWLHSYLDIYRLDQHKAEIIRMDGFGEKSWQRLWNAIQQSRNTTFERYVIAMDIPMVGNTASGALCREFHGSLDEFRDAVYGGYDFRQLPDFGDTLHKNIHTWFNDEENFCIWEELQMMMNIQKPVDIETQSVNHDNPFAGKTIVVTGKVEPYTRDGMNSLIASLGAVAGSSVTRKTDYLVCGEKAGSKLSKAQELGIPVLTPEEFFHMAGTV